MFDRIGEKLVYQTQTPFGEVVIEALPKGDEIIFVCRSALFNKEKAVKKCELETAIKEVLEWILTQS